MLFAVGRFPTGNARGIVPTGCCHGGSARSPDAEGSLSWPHLRLHKKEFAADFAQDPEKALFLQVDFQPLFDRFSSCAFLTWLAERRNMGKNMACRVHWAESLARRSAADALKCANCREGTPAH